LAQIENDLLKVEEAYEDADTRLKEAENDRRAAIDTINDLHLELDEAIAELRRRSIPGTKWHLEKGKLEDTLILQPENIAEHETASNRSNMTSVASVRSAASGFERLRAHTRSEDSGPVVKIVQGPGS